MPTTPKKSQADKDLCRVTTPEFRISYPHLFKAQAPKGGDKLKFSIQMLFPKDTDLSGIKAALKNAKVQAYGEDKSEWPTDLLSPVSDGDDPKYKGKEGYAGHWVVKASSGEDQRPVVVSTKKDAEGKYIPITEPSDVYPGCYGRAHIFALAWSFMGKEGVMFILDQVQKTRDGKSFGGKKPAEQVFAPLEDEVQTADEQVF